MGFLSLQVFPFFRRLFLYSDSLHRFCTCRWVAYVSAAFCHSACQCRIRSCILILSLVFFIRTELCLLLNIYLSTMCAYYHLPASVDNLCCDAHLHAVDPKSFNRRLNILWLRPGATVLLQTPLNRCCNSSALDALATRVWRGLSPPLVHYSPCCPSLELVIALTRTRVSSLDLNARKHP